MKVFKFKFAKWIIALIYVAIALCVIGFGVNIFFICTKGFNGAQDVVYPIVQYASMFFVTTLLCVILTSLLISSKYTIDDNYFITHFGIIKSKFLIADVEKIELDRQKNKLSVYFKSGEYVVVVVNEEWYNNFIETLLEKNKKIEYSVISQSNI